MRKSYRRTWRCIMAAGMTVGMTAVFLTGCGREAAPKKLMHTMTERLANVESFTNTSEMDLKMEDVVHYTKVTMDMTMETTLDPKAGHAKGQAEVVMRGTTLNSEMEIYQVEEGDVATTYSGMDGLWVKEQTDGAASGLSVDTDLFGEMTDSIEEFRLAEEAVTVEEQECYELYGDVTGEDLIGLLGSQMIHGFGLVELPDENAIPNLEIPLTLDIYKEELLPARLIVDMTDVLNTLYDSYDERTDVNDFTIELVFKDYDRTGEIVVPQEVINAAEAG